MNYVVFTFVKYRNFVSIWFPAPVQTIHSRRILTNIHAIMRLQWKKKQDDDAVEEFQDEIFRPITEQNNIAIR